MTTQFFKGLLMVIVSTLVSALSTTPLVWSMTIITLVGTILVYVGVNAFPALRPVSIPSTITGRDVAAALLILIGNGVVQSVAMIAGTGVILWPVLLKIVGGIFLTYITATFFSGPYSAKKVDWSPRARLAYTQKMP